MQKTKFTKDKKIQKINLQKIILNKRKKVQKKNTQKIKYFLYKRKYTKDFLTHKSYNKSAKDSLQRTF